MDAAQHRSQIARLLFTERGERDVRVAGVLLVSAPLGFTVPDQQQPPDLLDGDQAAFLVSQKMAAI